MNFLFLTDPESSLLAFLDLFVKNNPVTCSAKEKLLTRSSEWKRGWFKECGNPQPSGPRSYEVGKLSIYIGLNSVSLLCGVLVTCTILCACADGYTVNHSQLTFFIIFLQSFIFCALFSFLSPLCASSNHSAAKFQMPEEPVFCCCYLNFNYSRSIQIWPYQAQIKMFQKQIFVVDFVFFWLIELNNNILICSTV